MKENMGNLDRKIRIVIGLVIIALGVCNQSWWGLIGLVPLFTAWKKSCPLYMPCGLSTCKTKTEEK